MFNRKKKQEEKKKRLLEAALDVTSSDTAKALHQVETKGTKNQVEESEDELVVTTTTIPDDAPEIGPSYVEEPIEIGPSFVKDDSVETTPDEDDTDEEPVITEEEPVITDEEPVSEEDHVTPAPKVVESDTETITPEEDKNATPEEEEQDDSRNEPDDDMDESDDLVDLDTLDFEEDIAETEPTAEKQLEDTVDDAVDDTTESLPSWIWHDNDEPRKKRKKSGKKKHTGRVFAPNEEEDQEAPEYLFEAISDEEDDKPTAMTYDLPTKDKVDLESFFEASGEQKKLKRRDRKKYSKRELKRRKKRQNRTKMPEEIKDQRVFKFRKKKYKDVEEFIAYLNDHYLDIDDVARDVLADENFFGWVGKRSGVFPQSLHQFKIIKEQLESDE